MVKWLVGGFAALVAAPLIVFTVLMTIIDHRRGRDPRSSRLGIHRDLAEQTRQMPRRLRNTLTRPNDGSTATWHLPRFQRPCIGLPNADGGELLASHLQLDG